MKNKFHKDFKLNNKSFSTVLDLLNFSESISAETYQFLNEWYSNENFIIVKTSGSTGVPKSIKLKKEFVVNSALATGKYFKLTHKTTALLCLPIEYIAGKMMLIRALTLGWHLDVVNPNSSPLKENTNFYDFSAMVPLQVENSIDKLTQIKKLIVGGGVVSGLLQEKLKNISTKVYATYGMTETITHIAVKKLNNYNFKPSFFEVLPGVTIYKDRRNCLVIKASNVSDEIIYTNDIVQLISDNQFEWLGRFDNVINSGGIKLNPEKIEEKLSKIISSRFFVTGIPDSILGEKLILVVEGEKKKYHFSELVGLQKFEIPKKVFFVDEFVETETKKIQRNKTLEKIFTN